MHGILQKNIKFNTFKHLVLTNQYFNRAFAFMISTEFHILKNEEHF